MIIRTPQRLSLIAGHFRKSLYAWVAVPGNLLAAIGLTLLAVLTVAAVMNPGDPQGQSLPGRHQMVNCFWTLHDAALTDGADAVPCGDDEALSTPVGLSDAGSAPPPSSASRFVVPWLPSLRAWKSDNDDGVMSIPER